MYFDIQKCTDDTYYLPISWVGSKTDPEKNAEPDMHDGMDSLINGTPKDHVRSVFVFPRCDRNRGRGLSQAGILRLPVLQAGRIVGIV